MNKDLIENIARELCRADGKKPDETNFFNPPHKNWESFIPWAERFISTANKINYVVVHVEPTREEIEAVYDTIVDNYMGDEVVSDLLHDGFCHNALVQSRKAMIEAAKDGE